MPLQGTFVPHKSDWARRHVDRILETGTTDGIHVEGRPVVLVTLRGAKDGNLHRIPLMRVEHEGTYAIVASIGGAPRHPQWYFSVKAEPHVELQDGTETHDYTAREVTGEEKATWWERAVAAFPPYAEYQKKTTREIPVFVLERVQG